VHPQQLQQIEETRQPPVRKTDDDQTRMRGDRQDSMVGKHTQSKRQQTISEFHQTTKCGGQQRQEHHSKQPAPRDLQDLVQRAQTSNKTPSSSSHSSKQHPNNDVRDTGLQKPHDARHTDKVSLHHAAKSSGPQTPHQAKVDKGHAKQAYLGTCTEYGDRLKAKVPSQPKPPSSQRMQTQTRAQHPPPAPASLALKPGQIDKKERLARLAREDEDLDGAWSNRNVALYEASMPAPVVPRQTHASTSLALPKPVEQQLPPPPPVAPRPTLPSSALRKPNESIVKKLQAEGRRERERKARAQYGVEANDEDDLPGEGGRHDELFGKVSHKSWNPSEMPPSNRSTQCANDTPTQNAAASNDAKQPLAYGTCSGSNNLSGIHPGSLPSKPRLEYIPDNEDESDPTDQQPPPKGPFSLNSAAGVRAIEKIVPPPPPRPMVLPYETTTSSLTTTQRFMGSSNRHRAKTAGLHQDSPAPFSKAPASKSQQQLYITANDLQLYMWRTEKLTWAETRDRWSRLHGADAKVNSSEDTLRKRFRAVKKAIEDERVGQELCSAVLDGVEGAEEELNRLVAELQQEDDPELEMGVSRKIKNGKSDNVKQEAMRQQQQQFSTAQQQRYAGSMPPPNAPLAIAGTRPPSPLRATQGGKFYDATTFQAYIAHLAEARNQDSDSDSDAYIDLANSREVSPFRKEDYVQWEYYMERRDFTADDLSMLPEGQQDPTTFLQELDHEAEYNPQTRWKTYTHPFRTLSDANAEAARFIWTTPLGSPQTYSAADDYALSKTTDAFGMLTISLKSPLGLSQVRVARRLLTYQDHVVPERSDKEGWIPRVMWCVVVKVRDPKKGKEDEEAVVGKSDISKNKIFSSLALANARAIDEWVKLTVKVRSANLDVITIEREQAKIGLLRKLERIGYGGDEDDDGSGERATYFKEVLVEEPLEGEIGPGRRIEVFVQDVVLEGPRN